MLVNLENYKLVMKHFGKHIEKLLASQSKGRFIHVLLNHLEQRLQKLEPKLIDSILKEVGNNVKINLLDDRLMDAWAEIRTVSQLQKEGFTKIEKVYKTADFTACFQGKNYAIQVTRINRSLGDKMAKYGSSGVVNDEPFGDMNDIYERFESPLSYLFWDTLQGKNGDFRNWRKDGFARCIVIVSSEDTLTDPLVRHISCREIRRGIHDLTQRHFEELLWLPDLSNGAWFKLGEIPAQTQCWVDWCDSVLFDECDHNVNRTEKDLNSLVSY